MLRTLCLAVSQVLPELPALLDEPIAEQSRFRNRTCRFLGTDVQPEVQLRFLSQSRNCLKDLPIPPPH